MTKLLFKPKCYSFITLYLSCDRVRDKVSFVGLSLWREKFDPRSLYIRFVVHKVAEEQVSFQILYSLLFKILPLMLHIYISLM